MPYNHEMVRLLGLFAVAATCMFAGPMYSIAILQSPVGWTGISMMGINDAGQVAGVGNNGTTEQAFIATIFGSTVVPLPVNLVSVISDDVAINDAGQVVGTGATIDKP